MRNKTRIPEICSDLRLQWERLPDMRLGQLLCNIQKYAGNDLFYIEDDKLIELLTKAIDTWTGV